MRYRDLAIEQVPDGLRDDGLPVARRAVDEQGVPGANRRADLVQDPIAQHQVRERLAHALGAHVVRHRLPETLHVPLVLNQRHRRHAHVLVAFQEQRGPSAPLIRNAVLEAGPPIMDPPTIST